jgi:uncharacterized membrane protein YcaP (DUF421 family)
MFQLNLWAFILSYDMFRLGVPVVEKMLRPIIVYAFLVILLRIFGKRELATLNPFDLVVLLSLSNTVQNAIIGEDNSVLGGLIGAFTLLAVNYLVVRFLFKHRRLDQILQGSPTVLIEKGRLQKSALAREFLTVPELLVVANRQGFSSLKEIEHCILEPAGSFFIEGKIPPRHELRHTEIMARLDQLSRQIGDLKLHQGRQHSEGNS